MAFTSAALAFQRSRDYQWCWNSTTDLSITHDEQWTNYSDVENEIIEDAKNQNKTSVELDGDCIVNLESLEQYGKADSSTTRQVKRVHLEGDRSVTQFRRERFVMPVKLATSTSRAAAKQNSLIFDHLRNHGIVTAYYLLCENKGKTIADVVEEAAQGITKEGIALGKIREAEWLTQQLYNVKHFGANIQFIEEIYMLPDIPSEIGRTSIYLYSKESFWYKLINHALRDEHIATTEQVQTLGPFCFILKRYLSRNPSVSIKTVYRSLNLDDENRQQFMQPSIRFSAFTCTSKSRQVAEFYNGNMLLHAGLTSQITPVFPRKKKS